MFPYKNAITVDNILKKVSHFKRLRIQYLFSRTIHVFVFLFLEEYRFLIIEILFYECTITSHEENFLQMNKFKKKTRSKVIAASIAILSSAAVVSTGFAAWVISGGESKTAEGTITADEVSSKLHTIKGLTASQTINYGGLKTADKNVRITDVNVWLENDVEERLLATFDFQVENVQSSETATDIFKSITLTEGNSTDDTSYTSMATKGYVALLNSYTMSTITYTTGEPKLYNDEHTSNTGMYLVKGEADTSTTTTMNFKLYIVFGWGTTFESKNPWNYYNALSNADSTTRKSAETALDALHAMNAKLTVTIETK